jgi:hypothetical protein
MNLALTYYILVALTVLGTFVFAKAGYPLTAIVWFVIGIGAIIEKTYWE